MSGERERLRSSVADLIYARIGWTKAAEGASVDIAYFILADRKRILESIEECIGVSIGKIDCKYCMKLTAQVDKAMRIIQEHMPKG